MVKEKNRAPAREVAIKRRELRTINYEAFLKSQVEEVYRRKFKKEAEEKMKAIQEASELKANEYIAREAQKNIEKGEKNALIDICNVLINLKYKKKNNKWLNCCTIEELKKIILYTQEEEHNDYDELVDSIFSTNDAYASGR